MCCNAGLGIKLRLECNAHNALKRGRQRPEQRMGAAAPFPALCAEALAPVWGLQPAKETGQGEDNARRK